MYERGGGQAHPSLEYISKMWSWLDLVGYAKFRSIALVVWHRFQQRKLIPAKIEKHKKRHTIKTQNHQKQPDKIHQKKQQKQKTKATKKTNKTWSLTSFDYLVFC